MRLKTFCSLFCAVFSSTLAFANTCQDALNLFDRGLWSEAYKIASAVDLRYSNISDRCEFVMAASEPKAFSRIAKLELFIKKHPHSALLAKARYEAASTMWLLGDTGGALDKLARDVEVVNSSETEALLAFLLFSKAHEAPARLWLKRARSNSTDQFISDLLDLYILKHEFSFMSSEECASEVVNLLRNGTVDESVAMGLAEKAHAFSNNQTASLRFYIATNGLDEIASAGVNTLGLKEYVEGSKNHPTKRCLLIEFEGEESKAIESALWVWLKERGIEAKYSDDKRSIVVGPYVYEEAERIKMELEKFFDLQSKIGACPRKENSGGK